MIPIRVEDFKTMDDFAEKLAISREIQDHPTLPHSQVIQETKTHRIKLEKEHNAEIVNYLTQKKKKWLWIKWRNVFIRFHVDEIYFFFLFSITHMQLFIPLDFD